MQWLIGRCRFIAYMHGMNHVPTDFFAFESLWDIAASLATFFFPPFSFQDFALCCDTL